MVSDLPLAPYFLEKWQLTGMGPVGLPSGPAKESNKGKMQICLRVLAVALTAAPAAVAFHPLKQVRHFCKNLFCMRQSGF
jgi:hypothetical protein